MAMQQAWTCSYRYVVFEGDNTTVHKFLTGKELNFGVHNWVKDIKFWSMKFDQVHFQWTFRLNNKAADRLVKEPMIPSFPFIYLFYVPNYLVSILHEDYNHSLSS